MEYRYDLMIFVGDLRNYQRQDAISDLVFANPINRGQIVDIRAPNGKIVTLGDVINVIHTAESQNLPAKTLLQLNLRKSTEDYVTFIDEYQNQN